MTNDTTNPVTQADQIKHMTERFLNWRLPENFSPDAGISFKPTFNDSPAAMAALGLSEPMRHNPVGTNLFDYQQAEQMVRHMLEGLPGQRFDTPTMNSTTVALQAHHAWHLAQTDEDQHGIIPADAYVESALYDQTVAALNTRATDKTLAAELRLLRRREIQAIGAGLSLRDWYATETAYNAGRDRLDRILTSLEGQG